jgi:hypothetical protein
MLNLFLYRTRGTSLINLVWIRIRNRSVIHITDPDPGCQFITDSPHEYTIKAHLLLRMKVHFWLMASPLFRTILKS